MTDSDATPMDKGDLAIELYDQWRWRYIGNRDKNRNRTVTKTVTSQEGKQGGEMQHIDYMVRPEGLEPPTPRSVVWCSIH